MFRNRARGRARASSIFSDAAISINFVPISGASTSLDSRITFTRSTRAARVNSAGLIELVAINDPRFDYDPVTLAPEGLLIEEQRTNLILNSQNISLATWGSSGNITANVNSGVSPDGTQNATAVMETTTNGTHTIGQTFTVVANTNYAASIYLKANGRDQAIVYYGMTGTPFTRIGVLVNLSTGSFVNSDVGTPSSVTVRSLTPVGNGWYRVVIAGIAETTTTAGLLEVRFYDGTTSNYAGDSTKGMFVWGGQVEAGAFATSYIPTTTIALTRAADVASMTGANFSNWYNQTEGTVYTEFSHFRPGGFPTVANINNGSLSERINLIASTTAQFRGAVVAANVTQAEMATGTYTINSVGKLAVAVKANDFALAASNGAIQTDTSGTMPSVDRLQLGFQTGGLDVLNGHIRSFTYFPTRLSNEKLQALTS